METIIAGNRNKAKDKRYFKCWKCDWVGLCDNTEYHSGTQREPENWIRCPVCGNAAKEVLSREDIAQYEVIRYERAKEDYWKRR